MMASRKKKENRGGARKGAGRPSKGDEPRTEPIPVKLAPSELEAIRTAAEREGMTLTAYVRRALGFDD